jgi:hypothetical protein
MESEAAVDLYVVEQGDCLSSLTQLYGFSDYRQIYYHPNNSELRRKRPNPNVLYPGDEVFIPAKEIKEYSKETEKTHKFVLRRPEIMLRLVVRDENWRPFLGKNYELKFESLAKPYSGATSASDGKIEHPQAGEPDIPSNLVEAELTVWLGNRSIAPAVWKLNFGHLDPVEEMAGVKKRLANVGLPVGLSDGDLDDHTKAALATFQTLAGLEPTGNNDEKTRDALVKNHDKLSSTNGNGKPVPFVTKARAYAARLTRDSADDELSATLSFQRVFRFSI